MPDESAATLDLFGQPIVERRAIGAHEQPNHGENDEWLTPPDLIAALGPFDVDPCSPIKRPWDTATVHYDIRQDGLRQEWHGLVWMNPPYKDARRWLARLAEHGDGIALIFARTETRMFFEFVWRRATALLFLEGRLTFHYVTGRAASANSGAPSVLVAYGERAAQRLVGANVAGQYVRLQEVAA